jgi:hypothetical protein
MKDKQIHSVGAVNVDKDPRSLNPNEMSYALDSDILGSEGGQQSSVFPLPSSLEMFSIPFLASQLQYVRVKFNNSVFPSASSYIFFFKDGSGNGIATITITVNPLWSAADFVNAIDTALTPFGYNAFLGSQQGLWISLGLGLGAGNQPIKFSVLQFETVSAVTSPVPVYELQVHYNPAATVFGQFKPLQGHQVGNYLLVFSKTLDGGAYALGYAERDDNQDWTYTHLLITRDFNFTEDKVIEVQSEEVNSRQFGIYWIDSNGKPKVIYIPTDMTTPLTYTMTAFNTPSKGIFTLESLAEQTNLQIQNYSRINFWEQIESGGNLESGTWFYYVQAGIAGNYSEWSAASEPIAVFSTNTSSKSAGSIVEGDKTPRITSKVNRLRISSIDYKVYDSVRVAGLLNQGGVYSAIIIGEYNTNEGFDELYVTHSGKESSIEEYDRGLLPPVRDVISNVENIQIKKNRMNLSNLEYEVEQDLSSIFGAATLGQFREEITSVGKIDFSSENLFRAGLSAPYRSGAVNFQTVLLNNDTTLPNFDIGNVWDDGSRIFTVPTTGQYKLSYEMSFVYGFDTTAFSSSRIGPTKFFVENITTGEQLLLLDVAPGFLARNIGVFTLNALDQLAFKVFVVNDVTGPNAPTTEYVVNSAFFAAEKVISDYPAKSLKVGEYQLPQNIATKLGYPVNERYSFFARVEYNSGLKGDWHPINEYQFSNGNALAEIEDALLTNPSATDTPAYTYGLTINGINIASIKDKIKRIEIGRAICNPTILGTGVFIPSNSSTGASGGTFNTGLYTGNTTAATYGSVFNNTSDNRYFGVMLCPDWATGDVKPQFQEGDQLIVYGSPDILTSQVIAGGTTKWGSYKEFFGSFLVGTGSPIVIDIEDAAYCEFNTNSRVLRNDTANRFLAANFSNDGSQETMAAECMAMALGSRITPIPSMVSLTDYGVYYVQYYRPNANQYSNLDDTIVSTNTFIDITPSTTDILPEIQVFGGDTYTQKTYYKVLYNALNVDTAKRGTLSSFIGFYSQNKINQQLRFTDKTFNNLPFPFGNSLDNYLFGVYEAGEQFQIDRGYTWENPVDYGRAFDSRLPQQVSFKSRIVYSQQKVLNALEDAYRIILPNDFKDLAAKDGAIHALFDVNDVMVAIQEDRVSVLPYQSDVAISGAEVYIGNGGVYAQRENPISTYGTPFKTATVLAKNQAGNSAVYWWSDVGQSLMRYGSDGVKSLSNENGYRTWLLNNYKLCTQDYDVVLGFDQSREEIYLTARAYNKTYEYWDSTVTYAEGDIVRFGQGGSYQTFERLPDLYIAKGATTNQNPFGNPSAWEYIPTTDLKYYNYSTIIFNEKFNFFRGNFSLIVSRYFNYDGIVIVPRGRAEFNSVYNLFGGSGILQWLDRGGVFKQGSFEVEWSVNKQGNIPKRFSWYGLVVGTDHIEANNPDAVLYTATQTSDSVGGTNYEFGNGQIAEGVFSDHSDDPIVSEYMKIRLKSTRYLRIFNLVASFYYKYRNLMK